MRPRISLGYASRERPWRAGWPSYDFQSCCNSIAGKGMRIVHETRPRDLKGWMECRDQARPRPIQNSSDARWVGLTRLSFLAARGAGPPSRSSLRDRRTRRPPRGPPPAVLIVNRSSELGLRLPGGRDAAPVLRRAEDVLGLRERDEREVEPPRLPVEAGQVQERPAPALEVRPVVLPMEPLEGVEQERLRALRIVPVRREHAGREECLAEVAWVGGRLRLVQCPIEGQARVVPPAEFHQCVPLSQEGQRAHCGIGGCPGEVRIYVRRLGPSEGSLFLDAVMERGLKRLDVHRRPENWTDAFCPLRP